jgi:hypothetical protein
VAAGEAVGDAWRSDAGEPAPDEPVHRPVERSAAERRPAGEHWASTPERVDAFEEFEPEEGRAGLQPPAAPAPRPQARGMIDRRPRVGETRRRPPVDMSGPSWEQPRRYEAYPTLRTRMGLPSVPRVALAALALGIAAIALFSLPTILGLGRTSDGGGGGPASSSSTAPASAGTSAAASTHPAATAQVYVVKSGDNLGKIAKKFKTTIDAILKANPQIKDPNKIKVGDAITIPTKGSSGGGQPSATAAP